MMTGPCNNEPDHDSMMALQALLKIRSDSVAEPSCQTNADNSGSGKENDQPPRAFPSPVVSRPQHFLPTQVVSPNHHTLALPFRAVPFTPSLESNEKKGGDPKPRRKKVPSGTSTPRLLSSPPPNTEENSENSRIRQDQIEAALRSKPQRGRKRDNLSVIERLELTRTRNREHAKSTRVRKKARYEELVFKEEQLEELQKRLSLEEARRTSFASFFAARSESLSSSNARVDSASNLSLSSGDIRSFSFEAIGSLFESSETALVMESLENSIRSKVLNTYDQEGVSSLSYHLNKEDIAVTPSGVAIAEIEVRAGNALFMALIRSRFAPDSDKMTRLEWATLQDKVSGVGELTAEGLGFPSTSYPSVVSLDLGGDATADIKSPVRTEGPGMSLV